MALQFRDMETEITGKNIVLPNNLRVEQILLDASMEALVKLSGMHMSLIMTNRKVIAQESVTTPGGPFDYSVIDYTNSLRMGIDKRGSAKQWISEGIGLVKREDSNSLEESLAEVY
jgi:hypothetical protein